jgi:hypothetical protein
VSDHSRGLTTLTRESHTGASPDTMLPAKRSTTRTAITSPSLSKTVTQDGRLHRRPSSVDAPGAISESRPTLVPDFLKTATLSRIFDYFERQEINQMLADELGRFLGSKFLFTHFITVTLRRHLREGLPVPAGRGRLGSAFAWIRRLIRRENGGIDVAGIMVMEYQQDGTPHLHLLTTNTVALIGRERAIENAAWTEYGKCQVLRYRPNYGANFYLGKYIAKDSRVELTAIGKLDRYRLPGKDTDRDEAHDPAVRRQEQATKQSPPD